ncbi:hypothetical protein ACWODG_08785 [Enterococcus italicus]
MTGKWESQDDYQTTMTLTKTNDTLTYQVDDQKRTLTQVNQGAKDTSVYKDSSSATYKFIKKNEARTVFCFYCQRGTSRKNESYRL